MQIPYATEQGIILAKQGILVLKQGTLSHALLDFAATWLGSD